MGGRSGRLRRQEPCAAGEGLGVEARDREMRAGADLADAAEQTVKPRVRARFRTLASRRISRRSPRVSPTQITLEAKASVSGTVVTEPPCGAARSKRRRCGVGMGEARCDGGLPIAPRRRGYPRLRGKSSAPVGADHEPRGNLPALFAAQARLAGASAMRRHSTAEAGGGWRQPGCTAHRPARCWRCCSRKPQAQARRAENSTSGARNRLPDASMILIAFSGAAWGRRASHSPSAFNMSIELSSSAAVRVSRARGVLAAGGGPISATDAPPWASASAAAIPAGPLRPRQCRCRSRLPKTSVPRRGPKGSGIAL